MRWTRTLALPIVLLATSGASVTPRCSCASLVVHSVMPAEDVTLPPGSAGLRVVASIDPRDSGLELVRIRETGSSEDLDLTWEAADQVDEWTRGITSDWLVRPSSGFRAGATYTVWSWRASQARRGRGEVRRRGSATVLQVTVSPSARPELRDLALEVGAPVVESVSVPGGGGMCAEAVRSVARRIAVRFPNGLEAYRAGFQYETLVNGEPWYVRSSLCDYVTPGVTRYASGTDVVFAPCSRAGLLRTGTHQVAMRVRDIRTGEVAVTPAVPIEMVCSPDHPAADLAVRGVRGPHRVGEVRAVEALGAEDAVLAPRGGGILSLDGGVASRTTSADGLASDEIIDLMYDRDGRLWAVGVGGWAVYEDGTWRSGTDLGGLEPRLIFGISEDPEGGIWFSTDVGAARLRDDAWEVWTEAAGLPGAVVHATLTDREGTRWFACRGGIARAEAGSGRADVVFDDVNARAVLEAADGSVWFGTSDGALRFDGESWERSLEGVAVYPGLVDEFGDIWAGSAGSGLFRHTAGEWRPLPMPAEFRGSEIFDVSRAGGMIWLATDRGPARLPWYAPPESLDSLGVADVFLAHAIPSRAAARELLPGEGEEIASLHAFQRARAAMVERRGSRDR